MSMGEQFYFCFFGGRGVRGRGILIDILIHLTTSFVITRNILGGVSVRNKYTSEGLSHLVYLGLHGSKLKKDISHLRISAKEIFRNFLFLTCNIPENVNT